MAESEASAETRDGAEQAAARGEAERSQAPASKVGVLFVGDVVGGLGRHTLLDCLPLLRERYAPTFVVVNGENAAGGLGITPKIADQMFAAGVDAITPTTAVRSTRISTVAGRSCAPRTSCAASPAAAPAWWSAMASRSAS
jgi:hypothetical protein